MQVPKPDPNEHMNMLARQLEAAKQRELELLAVIEKMKAALIELSMNIAEHRTEEFHKLLNLEPSQALREHEAKLLDEVIAEWEKPWGISKGLNFIDSLRAMVEERRKK